VSVLAVPLVLLALLAVTPLLVKTLDRNAGWVLAAAFLATAGYILTTGASDIIDGRPATFSVTWLPDALPGGGDIDAALSMDATGLFFTLLALLIGTAVFSYSTRYLHRTAEGEGVMSFYVLMTAFMASVVLLFLADDVTLLFVGWELVSLASFFLIARSGHTGEHGAVRTLLLTFTGGLALLVALGIAVAATGTTSLSGILASDVWGTDDVRTGIVAVLVAVAGFSKAAQFPFHVWLPEAMAAATPVSAFLHAAAVVKAGIYLLLRFSTVFADVAVWNWLLIITGMSTAVMAAVFACQKTDLKKLTAYSTVSQLGWIVATIGVGTPVALAAAVVHTAAHAMFKSSLFMVIGVVDHQTGTRDIRYLGPLWRRMPWTFTGALLAVASMAGIPPLLGFVSKEGMLAAFGDAPVGDVGQVILLVAAGLGALATFLYSGRYLFGAFIDEPTAPAVSPSITPTDRVREASPVFWLPAVLPGVLSLPAVLVLSAADRPLDTLVASLLPGEAATHHSHLALWHGWGVPLAITLAVIVVGAVLLAYRSRWSARLAARKLFPFTGTEFVGATVEGATRWGRLANLPGRSLSPNGHVLWILVMVLGLTAAAFFGAGGLQEMGDLPPRTPGIDQVSDLPGLIIIVLVVMAVISTRSRLGSVILVGVAGAGVSWIMLTLGAPDVALTNLNGGVHRHRVPHARRPSPAAPLPARGREPHQVLGDDRHARRPRRLRRVLAAGRPARQAAAVAVVPRQRAGGVRGAQCRRLDHRGVPWLRHARRTVRAGDGGHRHRLGRRLGPPVPDPRLRSGFQRGAVPQEGVHEVPRRAQGARTRPLLLPVPAQYVPELDPGPHGRLAAARRAGGVLRRDVLAGSPGSRRRLPRRSDARPGHRVLVPGPADRAADRRP
jgi:multicomponent Na+:H+ antiporter subunit A